MSHVLCSVIFFADGEESISYPYARGTREQCERTKSMIGGVACSTAKRVVSAELRIMDAAEYDALESDAFTGGAA